MFEWRRPMGRLFCLLLTVWMAAGASFAAGQASGTVIISWPAFTTSSGQPVAAGTKSVSLGAQGTLSVNLVPNGGASPAGTYYTVVFQLDDSV